MYQPTAAVAVDESGRAKRDARKLIVDPTSPAELEGGGRLKRDAGSAGQGI